MLTETKTTYPGTSWFVLRTDDGRLVRPFDLYVLDQNLRPTGEKYALTQQESDEFDAMHERQLEKAIGQLPAQAEIIASDVEGIADDALLVPYSDDSAQPGVTITQPAAGTTGVATCVAVLISGCRGGRQAYGCLHLSSNDMADFDHTTSAVDRLWTTFTEKLGGDPDPGSAAVYAVGGADDDNVDWAELAGVFGACEHLAKAHPVRFDDARLPVNDSTGGVSVYINAEGVCYQDPGASDADSAET